MSLGSLQSPKQTPSSPLMVALALQLRISFDFGDVAHGLPPRRFFKCQHDSKERHTTYWNTVLSPLCACPMLRTLTINMYGTLLTQLSRFHLPTTLP